MRCLAALVAVLAGCYSPSPPLGIACASNGSCPAGQRCDPVSDRCVGAGVQDDAAVDGRRDAPVGDVGTDALTDAGTDGPSVTGCADGQREAFTSAAMYPRLAGCTATWTGTPSLRDPPAGPGCGDDLGMCTVPAAACSPGWHVCGSSGAIAELAVLTAAECHSAASTGRFVAAISHCANNVDTCAYDPTLPCFAGGWCSEPVCCGAGCSMGPGCASGVWPNETRTAQDQGPGCSAFPSALDTGVLCCS